MPARDPLDRIRENIERRYKKAVLAVAEEVTAQIQTAYVSAVAKFYAEFTPNSYNRTFSTFTASDHYPSLNTAPPYDNGFEAGIRVGPENIDGNPYRADKEWVFERTFVEGIHGYTRIEAQEWARKHAEAELYSLLIFGKKTPVGIITGRTLIDSAPLWGSSPKEIMDAKFAKISSKQNLNKMSRTKMEEAFK